MEAKRKPRLVNGYRVIYKPEHPKAMTSDSYRGWLGGSTMFQLTLSEDGRKIMDFYEVLK